MTQRPDPAARQAVFVLFGATGDLAKRMVLPALYRLACEGLLPRQWLLVGNGRGDITHENFRARVHDALTEFGPKPEGKDWDSFAQQVFFAGGGFSPGSPGSLPDVLGEARASLGGSPQLVHYLAVPPVAFGGLTQALGQHGLAHGARVVYEKPFGTSPGSFRELDRIVHSVLDEQQVYRIDHFLGKEATQDLHVLRFANSSSAAYWDREHVESVQIDVPETLGISDRAQFYDATGAVLDMLVTHLFQVAAEVAMEPPASLDALDLQAARERVIELLPAAGPAGGRAGAVRWVPGGAGCRSALQPGHVRGRPAVDRQPPLAARAVLPAHREAAGRVQAAGQPDPARAARAAGRPAAPRWERAVLLAGRRRGDRPVPGGQEARARAGPRRRPRVDPAGQPARRRPAATVRAADPRRPARRPLAVHPAGRAGRGVAGGRAAADQPAPGPRVRARLMGAGRSPRAHRTRAMAPGPVTTRPRPGRPAGPIPALCACEPRAAPWPASVSATRMRSRSSRAAARSRSRALTALRT